VRVDVFLNAVCILKSRSMAKEACDRGKVELNGARAKGSHLVDVGDRVKLDLGVRVLEVEVLAVPSRRVARKEAPDYYRVLSDERPELEDF
jgi:ribosomal 50S subunit-recycling heat shock protein